MKKQISWQSVGCRIMDAVVVVLMVAGLAKPGSSAASNDALVFLAPGGSVSVAIVKDNAVGVQQLSETDQKYEYISVAPNGKCVWVIDQLSKSSPVEGWRRYGPLDVYVVSGALLSIPPRRACPIALSPDGGQLLFIAHNRNSNELCCKNLSTGDIETLVSDWRYLQRPSWSPDGAKIAYFCSVDMDGYRLHVMDMTSRKDIEVAPPSLAMRFNGNAMNEIIWSPDGKRIFFTARYDDEAKQAVGPPSAYVVSSAGGELPARIDSGTLTSISADGSIANVDGKGYSVEAKGITPALLPDTILGVSQPSPSNKAAAYTKYPLTPDAKDLGGLWCKLFPGGAEVMISDKWWDTFDQNWAMKWTTILAPD